MFAVGCAQEESAGARLVTLDSATCVIQDGEEELRHRVRAQRVVSERLEDSSASRIVTLEDRADTVLGRGLRGGVNGQQHQHAYTNEEKGPAHAEGAEQRGGLSRPANGCFKRTSEPAAPNDSLPALTILRGSI